MNSLCYTPCFDCGCGLYSYSENNLVQGVYKLTCTACGRLIEGDRAIEIFEGFGLIEQNTTANE